MKFLKANEPTERTKIIQTTGVYLLDQQLAVLYHISASRLTRELLCSEPPCTQSNIVERSIAILRMTQFGFSEARPGQEKATLQIENVRGLQPFYITPC